MGKTIFISSHILAELCDLCDAITVIDRGRTKYSGTMDALLAVQGDVVQYTLALAVEHPAVEECLRKVAGVTDVRKQDGAAGYVITVQRGVSSPNDVLRSVIDCGAQIASFKENVRHLNEAFMDLTEPGVPT